MLCPLTSSPVVLSSTLLASVGFTAAPSHTGAAASGGFTSDLEDSTSGGLFWLSWSWLLSFSCWQKSKESLERENTFELHTLKVCNFRLYIFWVFLILNYTWILLIQMKSFPFLSYLESLLWWNSRFISFEKWCFAQFSRMLWLTKIRFSGFFDALMKKTGAFCTHSYIKPIYFVHKHLNYGCQVLMTCTPCSLTLRASSGICSSPRTTVNRLVCEAG